MLVLDRGCRVAGLRDADALRFGTACVRPIFGRDSGATDISLRLLEFAAGTSPEIATGGWDDVWYFLKGEATLRGAGGEARVEAGTGAYLAPGTRLRVATTGQLVVASACCPEPAGGCTSGFGAVHADGGEVRDVVPRIVRLADRREQATGDRWYRVLVDADAGCRQVTQFVGSIPPGRAPDHFHQYEEVIVVLSGEGRQWAGGDSASIAAGSCIYLPKGQVHCVENTGAGALVLLGMFYPAGSPAVRYETGAGDTTG